LPAPAIIYLGYTSPHSSSSLPGTLTPQLRNTGGEQPPWAFDLRSYDHKPSVHLPLFSLAPDEGYLAAPVARCAGGLLHHLFTLTAGIIPEGKCRFSGLFLWPDPAGNRSSTVAVDERPPPRVLPGIVLYGVRTFL